MTELLTFAVSAALMAWNSWRIAQRLGDGAAERFWIALGAVSTQLGILATFISLVWRLTPTAWLAVQAGVFLLTHVLLRFTAARGTTEARVGSGPGRLSKKAWAVLVCVAFVVLLSGLIQFRTPIHGFDEKMYNASRVVYWVENGSVLPYTTHNDRQTVFPFGGELYFLWPVLFTKSELIGRLVFWTAYPAAVLGVFFLAYSLVASSFSSVLAALAFASAPMVISSSIGLKPDMWQTVFALGAGFWIGKCCRSRLRKAGDLFLAALFIVLAANVKTTALAILPLIFLLPWVSGWCVDKVTALKMLSAGAAAGLLLSGLIVVLGWNVARYRDPLGPRAMVQVHSSEISLRQLYTHSVRLVLLIVEFPVVPSEALRSDLSEFGNRAVADVGAAQPLPLEGDQPWPGRYSFTVREYARDYSLFGLLAALGVFLGVFRAVREVRSSLPSVRLSPSSMLTLCTAVFLLATVWLVRWMTQSLVPERFLLAPYGMSVAIAAVFWHKLSLANRGVKTGLILTLAVSTFVSLDLAAKQAKGAFVTPLTEAEVDQPFGEPLSFIHPGARILLAGSQSVSDYPLFAPRSGYRNRVISWGKVPFNPRRMQAIILAEKVTHVLIENDQSLGFHWDPPIDTSQMVAWLSANPDFREIALTTPRTRLFTSRNTTAAVSQLWPYAVASAVGNLAARQCQ